jgi:hypothetical protein
MKRSVANEMPLQAYSGHLDPTRTLPPHEPEGLAHPSSASPGGHRAWKRGLGPPPGRASIYNVRNRLYEG